VIRATFQLTPGVGPYRERELWSGGVTSWDALAPPPAVVLSPRLDGRLREAVARAADALARGDADALARMLPRRERWRLYAAFAEDAAFLDVEADAYGQLSVVGVLDRSGPRLFVRGRDLHLFPEAARGWKLLVTYNGESYDAPLLEAAFPGWRAPAAHVDLRHLFGRLGHSGGLKLLEEEAGVGRPAHLKAVRGRDAVALWSRHVEDRDRAALLALAEYNLYDTVNLKALAALGYNRMIERLRLPAAPVPRWERGDVLYDVTKLLLAL
jgi:uncharacterized protein YprB with RNaseH-like and TPR domain